MVGINYLWLPPSSNWTLLNNDVHVWSASLNLPTFRVRQLAEKLSIDECIRAERFYFERDRRRFIVGRGLLRTILGCYLGIEPEQLQFCYGPHGRPSLVETLGESILNFNLSHSQDLALYAITRQRKIGIDVEYIHPIADIEQFAARFFSIREQAVFNALPANQKLTALFHCWTCKEAFVKAIGDGLTFSLNQFDVSLSPSEPAQLLSIRGDYFCVKHWSLKKLKPAPKYVAALAVEGNDWHLTCWRWPE